MANQFSNQYGQNTFSSQPYSQQNVGIVNSIVWVETEDEAKNWMVAPNNRVFAFVGDNTVLYIKEKNVDGRPLKTEIYDLERRTVIEEGSTIDMSKYVSIDDVSKIVDDAVAKALANAKAQQNKPKKRFYGGGRVNESRS